MGIDRHPLSDLERSLLTVADEYGFRLTHVVKYYCELEQPDRGVVVYLNRQRTPSNAIAVMVHPETDLTRLFDLAGATIPADFRHGTNLRRFPKRLHTGKRPITYGYSIECDDSGVFGRLLDRLV
ncbi:hypothetical protein [Nonomuraea sp. NEAU-A123]|uniref:hypothetical protein n=1 Tax=Nonomuraea sp. NEAU-A123 TaxID=2839649 RepID=UPI001BE42443|nr:hypothetical protein [Nonomuraea sp. NEAU-A123]MBT2232674.1 hypothetical protein [Nonomuraea sp. NEAU-A123]